MIRRVLKAKTFLYVGQCVTEEAFKVTTATRVQVKLQDFDTFLKLYFGKYEYFYAHDQEGKCKEGDIVLIRQRDEQLTKDITHDVVKILYPYGDVTDPISGEKCVQNMFRRTMKLQKELYGVAEDGTGGFDYDNAPSRGWQEDKKDFTHRVAYKKFHDFEKGHPMHNDPMAV